MRRLLVMSSAGFVLAVVACGEVLREDDPLADAGLDGNSFAETAVGDDGGSDGASNDSATSIDAPTCDVNLLPSDPTNCGECGHTCETACEAGTCIPSSVIANYAAVATTNFATDFLLEDGFLYVSDNNNAGAGSGVLRCPEPADTQTCNAVRLFFRPDIQKISSFDASVAYAAPYNASYENFDGGVGSFPVDAAGVDAMAKDETIINARSVAAFANTLIVATGEGLKYCNGTCKTLVAIAAAGTSADWVAADAAGFCYSGVVDSVRGVYCASALNAVPELRAPAKTSTSPRVTLVGDEVVWADDGLIASRKRSGGAPPQEIKLDTTVVRSNDSIVADQSYVIWTHQKNLYRCPRSGCAGDPTVLATVNAQIGNFSSVALLGKWIYFGEGGFAPKVLRIPR